MQTRMVKNNYFSLTRNDKESAAYRLHIQDTIYGKENDFPFPKETGQMT
jgi:hypothetical protein